MEALDFGSATNLQYVNLSSMLRSSYAGGKVAVPVSNYSGFAQFKHIEGVPASDGPGFTISRLEVLDALIEHLVKTRETQALQGVPKDVFGLSDRSMNALIDDLSHQIKNLTPAPDLSFGGVFGVQASQTGLVMSLLA